MTKSTLFIDESGKSSLADQNNRPFLLTGVILDNQEIQTVEGYFNYIKLKFGLSTNTSLNALGLTIFNASLKSFLFICSLSRIS